MTQPKTYSMDTIALSPTSAAGTTALKLMGSASLMTNYAPARAVDAGHRIRPVEDIHGNPIVISVGTEGALFAIMRSNVAATGWVQIDLTSVLNAGTVEAFGVHSLAGGALSIAVSMAGHGGPRVFIAHVPADPGAAAWRTPASLWTEQPNALGLRSVSAFTMGADDSGASPVVIATASIDGTNHDRYVVFGGSSGTNSFNLNALGANGFSFR